MLDRIGIGIIIDEIAIMVGIFLCILFLKAYLENNRYKYWYSF